MIEPKRLKKIKRFALGGCVTGVLLFLGFNCSYFSPENGSSPSSLASTNENSIPVGLLSAEQTLKMMMSVTGVEGLGELTDPADALIDETYQLRSGSLPSTQDIKQATGPTMIAATNLASTVCAKAVDRERATGEDQRETRLFFRELDFSRGLSAQNSDSVTKGFARIARNAWRRDVSPEENDAIITFAQEFSQEADGNDPTQTRLLAVSLCTVAVSGMEALTY